MANKLINHISKEYGDEIASYLPLVIRPRVYASMDYKPGYSVTLSNSERQISMLGVDHDTDMPQRVQTLIEQVRESVSKVEPASLVVESKSILDVEDLQLNQLGVSAKVTFYDPPFDNLIHALIAGQKFSSDQIFTWVIINRLWGLSLSKATAPETSKQIEKLLKDIQVQSPDFRLTKSNDILTKSQIDLVLPKTPKGFDQFQMDIEILKNTQSPFKENGVLNDIGDEINHVRDLLITANLLMISMKAPNVIAVYGDNHVVAAEPAIEAFLTISVGTKQHPLIKKTK